MVKKLPKILEPAEVVALLAQPNTDCPTGTRNRALLAVIYYGALRLSEARHLKPADITWSDDRLNVIAGKGGRDRNVYLPREIMPYLREWKQQRPEGTRFFNTLKGGELSSRYVQALVERLAVKARIPRHVTPHQLRHSRATHLHIEGKPIRIIQKMLGHADVQTTMIYTHVSDPELKRAMQGNRNSDLTTDLTTDQRVEILTAKVEALSEALNGHGEAEG